MDNSILWQSSPIFIENMMEINFLKFYPRQCNLIAFKIQPFDAFEQRIHTERMRAIVLIIQNHSNTELAKSLGRIVLLRKYMSFKMA